MFLLLFFYINTLILGISLSYSLGLLNLGINVLSYSLKCISTHIKASKNNVAYSLIIGPSGSGKTALLYRLKHDKFCDTTTSIIPAKMKVNEGLYLIDIPGNKRIINNYISKYIDRSKSVIFVIDSSNRSSFKEAAEIIYFTIINISKVNSGIKEGNGCNFPKLKVVVLCNKSDLSSSRNSVYVKEELERNIDKIRVDPSKLEGININGEKQHFCFDNSTLFDLTFLEASMINLEYSAWSAIKSILIS